MDKESLLKTLSKASLPDPYPYADEIMEAYEELDRMGSHEFTMLKLEYLKGRVSGPLKNMFSDYLLFHENCLEELEGTKKVIVTAKMNREELCATHEKKLTPDKIKNFVKSFIGKFYPEQMPQFDMAWKIFHTIDLHSRQQMMSAGALAATGTGEESDQVLPNVIVCVSNALKSSSESIEGINVDELKENIEAIAKEIDLPLEMAKKLKTYFGSIEA